MPQRSRPAKGFAPAPPARTLPRSPARRPRAMASSVALGLCPQHLENARPKLSGTGFPPGADLQHRQELFFELGQLKAIPAAIDVLPDFDHQLRRELSLQVIGEVRH